MVFDRSARQVTIDGTAVEFPNREYRLLEIFLGSLGRVLSKADLAEQLFGFDDEAGPNAIELYVARLRKRLNGTPVSIRTLRGLRSEEHTSELQSLMRNSYAVFCLKKKNKT